MKVHFNNIQDTRVVSTLVSICQEYNHFDTNTMKRFLATLQVSDDEIANTLKAMQGRERNWEVYVEGDKTVLEMGEYAYVGSDIIEAIEARNIKL